MIDEARLERLIAAYFDRELTAEEKRELEAMLLGSARAREIFNERAEFHGLAREWAMQSRAGQVLGASEKKKVIPFTRRAWFGAGLAACLALAAWWFFPNKPDEARTGPNASATDDNVAMLAQAVDVEWDGASFGEGSPLPKGWLKIAKGTLRLDFYSGARVILEGPASLELLSADLAHLENGKLTAHVPPPAQGFTVTNGELRVVDRGTEFGMNVSSEKSCEVHVFDGKVELQGSTNQALVQGNGVAMRGGKWEAITANRSFFIDAASISKAAAREAETRWEGWRKDSQKLRAMPDLKVYFDFEQLAPGASVLPNQAQGADKDSNGSIIGCESVPGRWARKGALGFARTSDRVRFRSSGSSQSVTMMAWVRVDSLTQDHNALFSMSPMQVGEIHWKIDKSGRLLLGLRAEKQREFTAWERLESPKVVTASDFGRWMHFATVIDGDAGVMKHFVNGEEVASAPMKRRFEIPLGMANLGNFDAAVPEQNDAVIRNFNGRIDEFALFTRALTAKEIAEMK